ncbi:leucine zipper protein 1-like [Physella acuta]|uniref:leucine zipper protein 1-like n=1 Tax=Physella acuta TaxID=109671 RepID=UPI0027DC8FDC|nr:leucine zipper protein 1-like [Physella acuta]
MRPRIHLELVVRHKKYLEEKIQVLEPVLEVLKNAVEKSQTWIEDKIDNPPLTYSDLCQELEAATLSLLNTSSSIINENKDYVDVEDTASSLSQSTPHPTAAEKWDPSESKHQVTKHVQSTAEILSRLEQIETAISSLQDVSRHEQIETAISSLQDVSRHEQIETAISSLQDVSRLEQIETAISSLQDVSRLEQIETAISSLQDVSRLEQIETAISSLQDVSRLEQIETAISSLQDVSRLEQIETAISSLQDANVKSTDYISEIKQWRDNFVTEQSDMGVNIEQLTKKQKQNLKNLRKQMSEQDNKVKELNKEIESLKEKETKSHKTLEKHSLNMKEHKIKLDKINKEMQDHTNKTDSITQEIKRHSDQIVYLQEENKILVDTTMTLEKVQSKHNVMYKLLQQRLMPIDKLIQIFNQNLKTREQRLQELENIEITISKMSKEIHLIESRVCNRYACHVELDDLTPVSAGSIISTFSEVREYNGQHFNQTTGTFVSPHDGLYLVCVSLHECEDKLIRVAVVAGGKCHTFIEVKCADTSAAGSVVVDMKKGQELYFEVTR